MTASIRATAAICARDFRIWSSYRMRFFSTLFAAAFGVTLFYYVSRLVSSPAVGSADDYFGFVVVGTATLEVLTATLTAPVGTLRSELVVGTFERMVVSAFGPVPAIVSLLVFPLLLGLVVGAVTITTAAVVFGLDLQWATVPLAIPAALLGAVSFAPFGLLMAAAVLVFKQTNAGAAFVISGLSLVAGLYFPVSLLPDWIQWASHVQPLTPAVDLMRHLLLGTPMSSGTPLGAVAKLVGFAAVLLPVATVVLRASLQRSRRNGTITEY
ncbi:MAG: type transport system permease protein [Solirubrobacterales bacterium]|jgi:ABC-2 type transport system permease protein|nr:type transport system permease protein [Solirubrobacterales bacterium]